MNIIVIIAKNGTKLHLNLLKLAAIFGLALVGGEAGSTFIFIH